MELARRDEVPDVLRVAIGADAVDRPEDIGDEAAPVRAGVGPHALRRYGLAPFAERWAGMTERVAAGGEMSTDRTNRDSISR